MKLSLSLLFIPFVVHGDLLYSTDFDDFQVGDDQWSANSDWVTDNSTSGVNFIDNLAFNQALGNTAGLGLNRPSKDRVRMLTQIPHDHLANGESILEIETLIAIKDSENNFRDDFFFSIYNGSGTRLASIRFDNEAPEVSGSNFGFWREDGASQFDTAFDFVHEELYDLFMTIDLASNTWSASVNGSPLFEKATFTNAATGSDIALGIIGFEWDLNSGSPFLYGDNFLLVADLRVVSKAPGHPLSLEIELNDNSAPNLSWDGFAGKTYRIEYSDSLEEGSWLADLPDSTFSTLEISKRFSFTLPPSTAAKKFFRLVQSE